MFFSTKASSASTVPHTLVFYISLEKALLNRSSHLSKYMDEKLNLTESIRITEILAPTSTSINNLPILKFKILKTYLIYTYGF